MTAAVHPPPPGRGRDHHPAAEHDIGAPGGRGPGRRPATTHADIEGVAIDLFAQRGFDETTVGEIAAAAGIARRTLFRYYPSKADLVWGDFAGELARLRTRLAGSDPALPVMEAIRVAVVEFNRIEPTQVAAHRRRMQLILGVPTLRANSTLRFAQWREVIADFAALRLGERPGHPATDPYSPESGGADHLIPGVIAHSALGATLAGYERWLVDDAADLTVLLDRALAALAGGFRHGDDGGPDGPPPTEP